MFECWQSLCEELETRKRDRHSLDEDVVGQEKWWGRNLSGRDSLGNALRVSRWGEKFRKNNKTTNLLGVFFGHKNNNSRNLQTPLSLSLSLNIINFLRRENANQCRLIPRLGVLIFFVFFPPFRYPAGWRRPNSGDCVRPRICKIKKKQNI